MTTTKSICDPELKARLDVLNLVPHSVSDVGWGWFKDDLESVYSGIADAYQSAMTISDQEKMDREFERLSSDFKVAVRKKIRKEFVDLALYRGEASMLTNFANAWMEIERLRTDTIELILAIRKIGRSPGGGMFTTELKRRRFYKIENNAVSELSPSALSFIVDRGIDITRLKVCPSCEGIFWQAHQGGRRQSETCGSSNCATKHWRRKKKEL